MMLETQADRTTRFFDEAFDASCKADRVSSLISDSPDRQPSFL